MNIFLHIILPSHFFSVYVLPCCIFYIGGRPDRIDISNALCSVLIKFVGVSDFWVYLI